MKPVIGLDIDGTLLDYHPHFIRFARDWLGNDTIDAYGYDARMPFHKYLGTSKTMYRKCKLAYRRGELKRSLPPLDQPYPNADELTHQLRRWGCDVYMCTTRPYLSHDLVDEATRHSLRRNGVVYQGLIWGEHKYRELVRQVGKQRIVGVLDDMPSMCDQATRLGLRTAFALRRHNALQLQTYGRSGAYPWAVAETQEDTLALLKRWLGEWRAQ